MRSHHIIHGGWNVISGSVQVSFQYMFRSLKNTQDEEPFHIKWRRHQDYCGLKIHHRGSSEASCFHHSKKLDLSCARCDDKNHFLYMLLQLFAMHKPRLQAPSDYISDVFVSLDPWPQHHSCSFRFKWLELIVPWGSSVIYRPGTLLLLYYVLCCNWFSLLYSDKL